MALSDSDLESRLRALRDRADDAASTPGDLAATVRSRHRSQRRSQLKVAAAGLAAALVLLAGQLASGGLLGGEREGDPANSPSVPTSPSTPPRADEPIDTTTWTRYTSAQYGFTVGHPPDWVAIPATERADGDTAGAADSPALDTFRSPTDSVRVSVWQVPLEPGTSIESYDDIAAWVTEYCGRSDSTPCTGVDDRAVELCLEARDCHAGLLVPFRNDVQAFFSAGIYDAGAMTVVTVWWGESASAVAPYGGARRLLEAFLSTMEVWPASTPLEERTCSGGRPLAADCQPGN